MPNWVYNSVSVTGDAADVARLKEQVGKTYVATHDVWDVDTKKMTRKAVECSDSFSFWNIVNPPEDKRHLYWAASDASADKTWGWYNWNNANWGTKWDASDVSLSEVSDEHLIYTFQTAWGSPDAALMNLAGQYPMLSISNEWEEEQGFGGTFDYTEGNFSVMDEYDVPATHEEQMGRKEYCYCEESDDPEDYPFADCPRDDNPLGISVREIEEEASV